MNRRGFISLIAGVAGAPLVPWRGLIAPLIVLPTRHVCSPWCNLHPVPLDFSEESLRATWQKINNGPWVLRPTQLIVSPQVKHLIDTDPVIREAARLAGANV